MARQHDGQSQRQEVSAAAEDHSARASAHQAAELDAVTDEITRWKYIAPAELAEYRCADGLLNEFKMMWKLRHRFPLHFIVFKQMACHLPHEANVEQYFSRAGNLSDPNTWTRRTSVSW